MKSVRDFFLGQKHPTPSKPATILCPLLAHPFRCASSSSSSSLVFFSARAILFDGDPNHETIAMAWLRSSGYLRCFYCGQRSQVKNDGFTREFLCRGCDATNYLDEVCVVMFLCPVSSGLTVLPSEWRHRRPPSSKRTRTRRRLYSIRYRPSKAQAPDRVKRRHLLRNMPEESAAVRRLAGPVLPRPVAPQLPGARAQLLPVPAEARRALPPGMRGLRGKGG